MPHPHSYDRHGRRFVHEEGDRDDIRRGRGHRHHRGGRFGLGRLFAHGDLRLVILHLIAESSYDDHSKNALWIGTPVPMRLEILRPTYRTELLPTGSAHPA